MPDKFPTGARVPIDAALERHPAHVMGRPSQGTVVQQRLRERRPWPKSGRWPGAALDGPCLTKPNVMVTRSVHRTPSIQGRV